LNWRDQGLKNLKVLQPFLRSRLLRVGLIAFVFWILLLRMDRDSLFKILQSFDLRYGLALCVVFALLLVLFAFRWWLIGQKLGVHGEFRRYFFGLWLSQAAGELGPPLVVGEWARFHALRGLADDRRLGLSQLIDRCVGTFVLWLMVLVATPYYQTTFKAAMTHIQGQLAAGFLILASLGVLIFFVSRLKHGVMDLKERVLDCLNPLKNPPIYLLSLLIQGLLVLNLVLAAAGLGLKVEGLLKVAWLGPLLLFAVSFFPGLVSDWGKREALAVFLLAPAGLSPEQALAVSLLYGGGHGLVAVPGIFCLRRAQGQDNRSAE